MNLQALRAYLAVFRLGSFSAAAEELGYTQSAISRQVSGLERDLGALLFERLPRGVRPSAAGEAFAAHARAVLAEAERGRRAVADSGTGRHVAVGATPSVAAGILPAALRVVRRQHPDVSFSLVPALSAELERRVAEQGLDVGFVVDTSLQQEGDGLSRELLGSDRMCVIVPADHRLAGTRQHVELEKLAGEVWVEDDEGSARLLRLAAAEAGFEPVLELSAGDLAGKVALVAAGGGVALIPGLFRPALRADVSVLNLRTAPVRRIYAVRGISTARRDDDDRILADLCQAMAEALPGSDR